MIPIPQRPPGHARVVAAAAVLLAACVRQGAGVSLLAERSPISAGDVRRHVQELAGDAYEGRGAGYAGEDRAASYIEAQFRTIGLHPAGDASSSGRSYRQEFQFHPHAPELPGQVLASRNVVGFLEGDDRRLRREIVVLGAPSPKSSPIPTITPSMPSAFLPSSWEPSTRRTRTGRPTRRTR